MFVTFKSDAFMTGNGFSLTYQVAGKEACFHVNLKYYDWNYLVSDY